MRPAKLPPIGLKLPPTWTESDEAAWGELTARSASLRQDVLLGGDVRDAVEQIRGLLSRGAERKVLSLIATRRGAGALAWLWCETGGNHRDSITELFVSALDEHHPRPSLLLTDRLEHVYFERFDALDELGSEIRPALARILRRGWEASKRYSPEQVELLASPDAPLLLAERFQSDAVRTVDGLRAWDLQGHAGGRFVELVRQYAFLDRFKRVPMGENDPVFSELRAPAVHDSPHTRGLTVGHAALSILIERAEEYPGDVWRDLVLELAGDPRLSHTDQYRRWWPTLGADAEARVVSWLAIADLTLFLQLLTEFSERDSAMGRMLPARRKLLDGLVDGGVVRRSRLYLGSEVRRFVQSAAPVDRRWDSARLQGSQQSEKALLYLDCGSFHLIEGSHNTKMWVYLSRPSERIIRPTETYFFYRELTSDLASSYEDRLTREQDGYTGPSHISIPHQGSMWQRHFLEFLRQHGVRLDPEAILEPDLYRRYRNEYGLVSRVDERR